MEGKLRRHSNADVGVVLNAPGIQICLSLDSRQNLRYGALQTLAIPDYGPFIIGQLCWCKASIIAGAPSAIPIFFSNC